MPSREDLNIHEAHQHAEHVHSDRTLAPVSLTMAILAVLAALISSLGHRAHSEVLLSQTQANFHKAELVGISTQKHADSVLIEMLAVLNNTSKPDELREKMNREIEDYRQREEEAKAEELHLEAERSYFKTRANRLDLAELLIETALVLCSITLLTKQRVYWFAGISAGCLGLAFTVFAFLISRG